MKMSEIVHLRNVIDSETSVIVHQNDTTFILGKSWEVCVEAPDGHTYKLNKQFWNAVDLVEFASRYPLEDPNCALMFIYNEPDDFETVCLVPHDVMVYAVGYDTDEYELEFKAY